MVAHVSAASSKPKVDLDLNVDMCVVGNNCSVIYDHNRPVMSTVTIQMMDTEVPRQLMPQLVSRSTEWGEVCLNDESSFLHLWSREPFVMPHVVSFKWCAS